MAQFVLFDDDPVFSQMLEKCLFERGLKCASYNQIEAFTPDSVASPDLFVVDLSMADPSGSHWEFGGILNVAKLQRKFRGAVPIWVLTGSENMLVERECLRKGAERMILKREGVRETAEDLSIYWEWRQSGDRRKHV